MVQLLRLVFLFRYCNSIYCITILGAAGVAGALVYAALLEVTTPKVALLIQLVVPLILGVRYVCPCVALYYV